jgi:hypothetical protein
MGLAVLAAATNTTTTTDTAPLLNNELAFSFGIGLLCLVALIVVSLIVVPVVFFRRHQYTDLNGTVRSIGSLFEVPYISWYMLHATIATVGIIAVVILGVDGVIDKGTVAALLGSLFGYILGTSTAQRPQQPQPAASGGGAGAGPFVKVTSLDPSHGPGGATVTLKGTGLDHITGVSLGDIDIPAGSLTKVSPTELSVKVPDAPPAPTGKAKAAGGAVKVTTDAGKSFSFNDVTFKLD